MNKYTAEDLEECLGIRIEKLPNVCFLNRYNTETETNYWAECKLISRRIKEVKIYTIPELLEALNKNPSKYVLVK